MREYKIVGTKNMKHKNGKVDVVKNIHPAISGYGSYGLTYSDLKIAKQELEAAQKDMTDWESKHNANAVNDKYGVIIHWTDLHLVSREVSEWEEVK